GLEHRYSVGEDLRAGLLISLVGAVDALAGAGLDHHLVPMGDELRHRRWGEAHAILMNLDFLRHSDAHASFAPMMMIGRAYRRAFRPCPDRLQRRNGGAS